MKNPTLEECVKAVMVNEVTKSKMATGTMHICGKTYRVKVTHSVAGNEILRVYGENGGRVFKYTGEMTGRLLTCEEIEAEYEKQKQIMCSAK